MKTVLDFLSAAFRNLVLKPFDFVLFGGSGLLYRSRDELREAALHDLRVGTLRVEQHEGEEDSPTPIHKTGGFMNLGLPDVRYGPINRDQLYPPGG